MREAIESRVSRYPFPGCNSSRPRRSFLFGSYRSRRRLRGSPGKPSLPACSPPACTRGPPWVTCISFCVKILSSFELLLLFLSLTDSRSARAIKTRGEVERERVDLCRCGKISHFRIPHTSLLNFTLVLSEDQEDSGLHFGLLWANEQLCENENVRVA